MKTKLECDFETALDEIRVELEFAYDVAENLDEDAAWQAFVDADPLDTESPRAWGKNYARDLINRAARNEKHCAYCETAGHTWRECRVKHGDDVRDLAKDAR